MCRAEQVIEQVKRFLTAEEIVIASLELEKNNDPVLACVLGLAQKELDSQEEKNYTNNMKGNSMIDTERTKLLNIVRSKSKDIRDRNDEIFRLRKRITDLDKVIEAQGMKIRHLLRSSAFNKNLVDKCRG